MTWTNRGAFQTLNILLRNGAEPTVFYLFLMTSASTPTDDTNTKADITECPNGVGYTTGGVSLSRNSTDFDVLTEDDANGRAFVQLRDITWTASGGDMPSTAARYAGLSDDNGTDASREIYAWWDLSSNRQVSDGQTLTLQNAELRLSVV